LVSILSLLFSTLGTHIYHTSLAIAYSCIAPLVLGFAAVGLILYYLSYRYNLLFTMSPSIDTKGHAYTLALQHLLTGIYIAELALIGLFSLDTATGPAIMLALLLIATVIFNYIMNKHFEPYEQFLPAALVREAENSNGGDEQTPLLSSAEEGRLDAVSESDSHVQRLISQARPHVPSRILSPLERFFEPRFYASHAAVKKWLADGDWDEDAAPQYSEEQIKTAYLNPVFKSHETLIWLPRYPEADGKVSKQEAQELQGHGIEANDSGAWVEKKTGKVKIAENDLSRVPIFKQRVEW